MYTLWRTFFKFRACLASRSLCSQYMNKYSNKAAIGYERIIGRYQEDLATLTFNKFHLERNQSNLFLQKKLFPRIEVELLKTWKEKDDIIRI